MLRKSKHGWGVRVKFFFHTSLRSPYHKKISVSSIFSYHISLLPVKHFFHIIFHYLCQTFFSHAKKQGGRDGLPVIGVPV